MFRVEKLNKSFGGLQAVRDVSFEVQSGQLVGLIGPNGAGKSTVFNLATGVIRPDSGDVFVEGRRTTGMAPEKMCRLGLGRTFQQPRIFPRLTVADHLGLATHFRGRSETGAARSTQHAALSTLDGPSILSMVGLAGTDGRQAGTLSVLERKRLELARALASAPRLLMVDEPAAGLHSGQLEAFGNLLRYLNKELAITVLIVEHRMALVRQICTRVMVLDRGQLIAEGPPDEVLTAPHVVRVYLGSTDARAEKAEADVV